MQVARKILELEKAAVDTCGSKAAACAELARLAEQEVGFSTASGVCLPFGNMEYAVEVNIPLLASVEQGLHGMMASVAQINGQIVLTCTPI